MASAAPPHGTRVLVAHPVASAVDAAIDAQRRFMDTYGDPLENLLSVAVYLVPVQDEQDDLTGFWSQVVYSVTDLVNLYRTVLLRLPDAIPVAVPANGLACDHAARETQLQKLRRVYTLTAFSLRTLRSVQVLLEMRAVRNVGAQHALRVCLRIEVVKLALKVVLRIVMPFGFYIDEDALEAAEPPAKRGRPDPAATMEPADHDVPVPGSSDAFIGRRSGRRLRGLPSRGVVSLLDERTASSARILLSEALFHCRPLLHIIALIRKGPHSWAPWFFALVLDRLSFVLLATEVGSGSAKRGARTAALESAELNRRKNLIWWALARTPFFDKFLEQPSNALDRVWKRIPILNIFNVIEVFLALRPFYFTSSGT